jgi:hypothetical protein
MKGTAIQFTRRGFHVQWSAPSCSKLQPFLKRCRYHLLWNVLPTLLMLVAVGWVSLFALDKLDGNQRTRAKVLQRTAG